VCVLPANSSKERTDERTRTADLISLRVITQRCGGVQGVANATYLEGFPFPALLSVAPYCVPGCVRVVSRVRGLAVAGCCINQIYATILSAHSIGAQRAGLAAGIYPRNLVTHRSSPKGHGKMSTQDLVSRWQRDERGAPGSNPPLPAPGSGGSPAWRGRPPARTGLP
jgi:hypothetical protein